MIPIDEFYRLLTKAVHIATPQERELEQYIDSVLMNAAAYSTAHVNERGETIVTLTDPKRDRASVDEYVKTLARIQVKYIAAGYGFAVEARGLWLFAKTFTVTITVPPKAPTC